MVSAKSDTEIKLQEGQHSAEVTIPVKSGEHQITFVGLKNWGLDHLRGEMVDAGAAAIVK